MSPTAPSVPAGTILGHSYEYGLDINLGTHDSPVWQPARRISDFQPTPQQKTQPAESYDDFGADNADVVSVNVNLGFSILGNRSSSTGLFLPELEAILAAAKSKGAAAIIEARWYHKPETGTPNPNEAGQGYFTAVAQRANIGADGAVERYNVTLTGKGPFTPITNPFAGWGVTAPTIASIAPAGTGSGELVTITGAGFVGATGVTFDSIAADDFQVIGGSTIVAILPTDSAGTVDVVVTNAAGPSAAFAYTRGA